MLGLHKSGKHRRSHVAVSTLHVPCNVQFPKRPSSHVEQVSLPPQLLESVHSPLIGSQTLSELVHIQVPEINSHHPAETVQGL